MYWILGFIGLAIIFWFISERIGSRKKKAEPKVYPSTNKSSFKAFINYHVSSLLNFKFKKLIALSVTIVNRKDTPLNKLSIVAMPGHKPITYRELIEGDEQAYHFHHAAIEHQYKTIEQAEVQPNDMRSGYLLFETDKDYCDIDKLIVTCDGETTEIAVRKDKVLEEQSAKTALLQ